MKKIVYIFAIALLACAYSCSKDETTSIVEGTEQGQQGDIILEVGTSLSLDSRVGFTDNATSGVDVWWENNDTNVDEISIFNTTETYLGNFTYIGTDGAESGKFKQTSAYAMPSGTYTVVFPAVSSGTLDDWKAKALSELTQTTNNDMTHLRDEVQMMGTFSFDVTAENNSLTLTQELSLMTLKFKSNAGLKPTKISLRDGEGSGVYTLNLGLAAAQSDDIYTAYFLIEPNAEADAAKRFLHYTITLEDGTRKDHTVIMDEKFVKAKRYSEEILDFNGLIPVYNRTDLENIADYGAGSYFLVQDIDLTTEQWTPINGFSGTLDGNNKTIKNLTITSTKWEIGLFSLVENGVTFRNIKFDNVNIEGAKYIGALVGHIKGGSKATIIANCEVLSGTTTSTETSTEDTDDGRRGDIGGLIGFFDSKNTSASKSFLVGCTNYATVNGRFESTGGVIGGAWNANIIACVNHGNVNIVAYNSTQKHIGGVIGLISDEAAIYACYNSGNIENLGGIISGYVVGAAGGDVMSSYNIGEINLSDHTATNAETNLGSNNVAELNTKIPEMNAEIENYVNGVVFKQSETSGGKPFVYVPNQIEIIY